jgi:hypothetical protein
LQRVYPGWIFVESGKGIEIVAFMDNYYIWLLPLTVVESFSEGFFRFIGHMPVREGNYGKWPVIR